MLFRSYGRDYISSQGAQPGDKILLTKGAGVEAAALLACELRERLQASGVAEELLDRAAFGSGGREHIHSPGRGQSAFYSS